MKGSGNPAGGSRPKRVLLAWENGAGRTHYGNLLSIAAHLKAAGAECLATLHDLSAADREFASIGVRTVQNFIWPSQKHYQGLWKAPRVNGFTDFLASIGLNSSEAVAACIAHYDGLFSLFRPDLVLCDQAYGAVLACRDHLPAIAMASAAYMPPVVGDGFPLLPGRDTPGYPVDALLHDINVGLGRAGRFPLSNIGDVLRSATVAAIGPAEFDLYASVRQGRILPPLVPGVPAPQTLGERTEVFVYLHDFVQRNDAVLETLAGLDVPARIYLPGITPETRRRLTNMQIQEEAVPVVDLVTRSRCVVHHGGTQLTAVCTATGTPQLILAKEPDNRIAASFVEKMRIGEGRDITDANTEWLAAAIRRAYADRDLLALCVTVAPNYYERWFAKDTAALLAGYALDRIARSQRSAAAVTLSASGEV